MMEANLYAPAGDGRRAAVLLIHGVVETGKDDPRMIWLARLLARSGFTVLVPDFLGFKSLRLRVSDIGEMVDAVVYLRSLHQWVLPDRIGMIGFSYGAGPMLIAGADPRVEGRLRFVVPFGGYYDLVQVIKFVTTGYYQRGQAVGYTGYPAPPGPVLPQGEFVDRREIDYISGRNMGTALRFFTTKWSYMMGRDINIFGSVDFRPTSQ